MGDGRQGLATVLPDRHGHDHVGQGGHGLDLKPVVHLLEGHGGGKRPEGFPLLDHDIDAVAHLGMPRIGHDAPMAQRAGPKLHFPAVPGHDLPLGNAPRRLLAGLLERRKTNGINQISKFTQSSIDFFHGIGGAEKGHRRSLVAHPADLRRPIQLHRAVRAAERDANRRSHVDQPVRIDDAGREPIGR